MDEGPSRLVTVARQGLFVLLVAILLACLPGCSGSVSGSGENTQTQGALILIVSVHQNVPAPDTLGSSESLPNQVTATITDAVSAGEPCAVIALDGTPEIVYEGEGYSCKNSTEVNDAVNALVQSAANATADSDGDDLSGAISQANDFAEANSVTDPTVIIIDSGLSDRDVLDFTQPGMTDADPAQVAAQVAASGALPQLSGDYWLVGFGYTAAPQETLSLKQQSNVAEIWEQVLTEQGATTVTSLRIPRTGDGPDTQYVTATVEPDSDLVISVPTSGQTYTFDDTSSLGFVVSTATYRDPDTAEAALEPLATWLAPGSGHRAVIEGRVSSEGDAGFNQILSQQRAEAVKDTLTDLGADPSLITATGVGYTADPPDTTSTGALDPGAAALNRIVDILLE